MAFITGLAAVQSKMRRIPDEMKSVLRGAARSGGKVFAEYVKEASPSDDVKEAVRIRTTQDDEYVRATVDLKPGWGRTVGNWMEYGTKEHFISVDDSQRRGRGIGLINQQLREAGGNQSLVIGGKFVGKTVWHPGTDPQPVFRPARDLMAEEAKAAAQNYIRTRIKRGVIIPGDEGEDD